VTFYTLFDVSAKYDTVEKEVEKTSYTYGDNFSFGCCKKTKNGQFTLTIQATTNGNR
jgi:hypothetical protein